MVYGGYLHAELIQLWIRILSAMEYGVRPFLMHRLYCQPFPEHNYWSCGMEFQKLFLITLYTEHSPLVAESRSTLLIISLHLGSCPSLSSPLSSSCCLDSHCSLFLSYYFWTKVATWTNVLCGNISLCTNGQNTYTEYARIYINTHTHIYIYRQFSVSLQVLGEHSEPHCKISCSTQ